MQSSSELSALIIDIAKRANYLVIGWYPLPLPFKFLRFMRLHVFPRKIVSLLDLQVKHCIVRAYWWILADPERRGEECGKRAGTWGLQKCSHWHTIANSQLLQAADESAAKHSTAMRGFLPRTKEWLRVLRLVNL
jgi:hypothetical protein